jgi:hypothetical protein
VTQSATGRPLRCRTAAAGRPTAATTAAAASQAGLAWATDCPARAIMANRDWFTSDAASPALPACRKYPVHHHRVDAPGRNANPATTVPANAAAATAACRSFPQSTRYGMKISGVSLIPAARPMPAPLCHRRSGWHRSQTIRAISSSSIWPSPSPCCTGSVHSTTAVRPSAAVTRARPVRPSAPSVSQMLTASAATLATITSHFSTVQGSSEVTANASAANGG